MKTLLTSAFLTVAACAPAAPAMAQGTNCGPADQAEAYLQGQFGEEIAAYGMTEDRTIIEFWVNDETGTWTLTMRQGDSRCLIESGINGQSRIIGEVF